MKKIRSLYAYVLAAILTLLCISNNISASGTQLTYLKDKPQAPDWILQDVQGRQHALSDYRGKIVVVNFWATWCPPCRAEMPSMQKAADYLAKYDIPLIGIGVGENRERVLRFLHNTPLRFTLLLDTNSQVMEQWAAKTLPTTYVLNQKGQVVYAAIGQRQWDSPEILKHILDLRKQK